MGGNPRVPPFVSNTANVSYRPKFGCYIESLSLKGRCVGLI